MSRHGDRGIGLLALAAAGLSRGAVDVLSGCSIERMMDAGMKAKRHFEDFEPGAVAFYGPRLVTREEIVAFAAEFDPQPMHLDEAAAGNTLLGGLAASGWHTCCLFMRIIADGFVLETHSMGSPGVDEARWLKPLRPGTRIRVRMTVLDKRVSCSRPEMGLVRSRYDVLDDEDSVLATLSSAMMIARRTPEAPA